MSKKESRNQYMRQYRRDKKAQDNESKKALRELEASYKEHRQRIEAAMAQASPGTQTWLKYAESLAKLDQQRRTELTQRGFVPKDLATGTIPAWRFVATVAHSGSVTVVEVQPGQPDPVSAPFPERSAKDLEIIRQLNEEFGDADTARKEPEDE